MSAEPAPLSVEAFLFLDPDLRIGGGTPGLDALLGLGPDAGGTPFVPVAERLGWHDLPALAREVWRSGQPEEREVQDPEGRWLRFRVAPYRMGRLPSPGGEADGFVVCAADVSAERAEVEGYREGAEVHRLLVACVKEYAMLTTDVGGRIVTWNPGAKLILGWEEDEAVGQHARMIFTPEDRAAGADEAEMAGARQDGEAADERWHVRKSGERFWGSGVLIALRSGGGTLRGYAKVLRDNTHRREQAEALRETAERLRALNETLEERVAERTDRLRKANARIRRLASDLVLVEQRERHRLAELLHDDLQQVLFAIQLKLSLVREDAAEGHREGVIKGAEEASMHLVEAIRQTRQFTVNLSPPVLQGEGLAEALRWLVSQAEELHGLHVDVDAEAPSAELGEGMRILLFQITRELLFNVAKHAGVERAHLRLSEEDGALVLHVRDEGAGFEAAARGGFGLRTVRERAALFGGRVEVETAPGEGTLVRVVVPFVLPPPEEASEEGEEAEEGRGLP